METDLHQVIKANDDLTHEHHQFFLYQVRPRALKRRREMGRPRARLTFTRFASPRPSILAFEPRLRPLTPSFTQTCARPQLLRGLKYVHTANVYHRDLKPKNILANAVASSRFATLAWRDQRFTTADRRQFSGRTTSPPGGTAPRSCAGVSSPSTPPRSTYGDGCIFAEILSGRPLFPGKNVVHQLEIITDLLGTPHPDVINRVRNEKARRFLGNMRVKPRIPFASRFPGAAPAALALLERMLAFDPEERPTAEEALADPYFAGLSDPSREPAAEIVSRTEYAFESRKLTQEEVRGLLYREILEYHPQAKREFEKGESRSNFQYPNGGMGADFAAAEERDQNGGAENGHMDKLRRSAQSLPKESVDRYRDDAAYLVGGNGRSSGATRYRTIRCRCRARRSSWIS